MKNKSFIRIKAILQVTFIVILHLFIIYFLKVKAAKWEEETIKQMFMIYSVLIILLYATCMMSLVTRKIRYNLIWFGISTIPSISILFFLEEIKGKKADVPGIVDFKFDDGLIELMFLFPFFYLIIQLILMVALWILKFSKSK